MKRLYRRHKRLLLAVPIVVAVAAFGLAQSRHATAASPAGIRVKPRAAAQIHPISQAAPTKAGTTRSDAVADSGRKPLTYYVGGIHTDLFGVPAPVPTVKPTISIKPILPPMPPPNPAILDPFSQFAYTGTVEANGETMVLLENTKTRDGSYLKIGDGFMGGQISDINPQMVTVTVAGLPHRIAKNQNYSLTPLNAPPTSKVAAAPVAGAPNSPQVMTGSGQPTNLQFQLKGAFDSMRGNMTPEMLQQFQAMRAARKAAKQGAGGPGAGASEAVVHTLTLDSSAPSVVLQESAPVSK